MEQWEVYAFWPRAIPRAWIYWMSQHGEPPTSMSSGSSLWATSIREPLTSTGTSSVSSLWVASSGQGALAAPVGPQSCPAGPVGSAAPDTKNHGQSPARRQSTEPDTHPSPVGPGPSGSPWRALQWAGGPAGCRVDWCPAEHSGSWPGLQLRHPALPRVLPLPHRECAKKGVAPAAKSAKWKIVIRRKCLLLGLCGCQGTSARREIISGKQKVDNKL